MKNYIMQSRKKKMHTRKLVCTGLFAVAVIMLFAFREKQEATAPKPMTV
jgi:hypothetical protein